MNIANISKGKKGYSIALRTGTGMKECDRVIQSIEHFHGHLEIECSGSLELCSIENQTAVEWRRRDIEDFCQKI